MIEYSFNTQTLNALYGDARKSKNGVKRVCPAGQWARQGGSDKNRKMAINPSYAFYYHEAFKKTLGTNEAEHLMFKPFIQFTKEDLNEVYDYSPECFVAFKQFLWLKLIETIPFGYGGHIYAKTKSDLARYLSYVCIYFQYSMNID